MTSHYARGADFERRVAAKLVASGYFVIRAAGSHGLVDLCAFIGPTPHFVQCKGGKRAMSGADRDALIALAKKHSAVPLLASRGMVFTDLRTGQTIQP